MPQLSIIIPVYNTEKYLEKCVNSVFDTSFDSFEVILVDDGSTDGSLAVAENLLRKYPEKIRVVHQRNQGLGGARNTGIHTASGEYLMFIDSDDYLVSKALDIVAGLLKNDADLIVFDAILVSEQGREIEKIPGCKKQPENLFRCPELLFEYPAAWNKIVRKSLMTDMGILFPPHAWFEDLRTTPKIYLHAQRVYYAPEPLYRYVLRQGSIMNTAKCQRNLEIIDAVNDLIGYFRAHGQYKTFFRQLEYLAFKHQLIVATTRVNKIDPHSPVLLQLKEDFLHKFPDYQNNPYVIHAPWQEKMVLFFILHGWYLQLNTIMTWNKKRKGKDV